ncbi:MAG TPA: ABC transporter permease, partial [Myxococcota bacterium]
MKSNSVSKLGFGALELVGHLGGVALFLGHIGRVTLKKPYRIRRLVNEVFDSGVLSLAIVCLSGATVGAVLGLQGYTTLSRFGATGSLG